MKYLLQWDSPTAGLQWEHEVEIYNDKMAIEYASQHLKRLPCCPGLYIWRIGYKEGDEVQIARLTRGVDVKIEVHKLQRKDNDASVQSERNP